MITCVTNLTPELLKKSVHYYCESGKYKKIRMFFYVFSVISILYVSYVLYKKVIVMEVNDISFLIMEVLAFIVAIFGIWFAAYGIELNLYYKTCREVLKQYKEGYTVVYNFSDEGFFNEVNGNILFIKWETVLQFLCNSDYYFFITQEQKFGIIDKKGFKPSDIPEFEKLIYKNISKIYKK